VIEAVISDMPFTDSARQKEAQRPHPFTRDRLALLRTVVI
jgi:hypothetical protein